MSEFTSWLSEQNTNGTPVTVDYITSSTEEISIDFSNLPSFDSNMVITLDTDVPASFKLKY